ncbi:hypothetical protein CTEN210_16625 [Chaetoceros tenuissimus]|uniref:Arf-GAP domain-containing protein n=1 Tax=Chaetoceros tenuissimus TaxID=426638 RepID=A0AAD3DCJ4_9STRA|nr:hypothetical protein CTEN210_16625 [Chaetoceros tenuissimus]
MKDNEAMDRSYVKEGHNYPQNEASNRSESKRRPFDPNGAGDQEEEEWAVADVGNSEALLVDFGQRRSNSASSGGISCEEEECEHTNEVVQPGEETQVMIDSQQSSEESIHVSDNDDNGDMKNDDDELEINIGSASRQEVAHTILLEQNVETMKKNEETNNEHHHIKDMEEDTMQMIPSKSVSDDYDDGASADNKVDIDGSQHRPLPEIFDAMKVLSEQPNLPDSIKNQLKQYMQENINNPAEQRRESTTTERIIQRIDNSWNSHMQRQTEEQSTTTSSHSKSSLSLPTLNGLMDDSVSSSYKNFENNHYIEQNEECTMKSLEETEASDIPKQEPKTETCDIYNPHLGDENEEALRNSFKNNAKHSDLSLPSIQSQRDCNKQQNPSKVCPSEHIHNESEEEKEESLRNSLMNSAKDSELSLGTVQSSHTTSSYMSTSAKLGFHVENIDDFNISSGPLLSRRLKKTRHIQTESESANGISDVQQGSPKTKKQVSSVISISAESIANLPSFYNADRSRRGKTSRYSKHSKAARRDSGNSLINLDSSNHTSGRRLSNESSMDSSYHTYSSSRRRSVEHSRRHSNESRGSRGSRFDTRRFSNDRDQGRYHIESDNLESVRRHSNDSRRVRDKSTDHSQRRFSNGKMRYGNESSQRSMSIPFTSRPIEDRVSRSLHSQQREIRSREMLSKTHHTHGGIADEINHDIDNDGGSVASADSMAMTVEFNGKSLTVKRKENLKEVGAEAVAMKKDLHTEIDDAISKLCEIGQSTRKRNKNPVDMNGLTYSMAPNTTVFKKTSEIRTLEYWLEHCREKIALSKVKEKRKHTGFAITVKNKAKFEYSLKKLYAKECQAENDIRHLLSNSNLPDSQDVLSSVCRAARLTRTLSEDFQRHIQVKPRKTPRRSSLDLRKSSMSIDIASHTKDQNVPSQSSFPRSLFRIISLFQGNEKCCDCAEGFRPSDKIWASISYGTLLCESCAMRHFNVQIKINLEEEEEVLKQIDKGTWDFVSIITMLEGGNKKMIDYMGTHDKSFKSLQTKTSKRKMSLVHSATVKGHATDDETSFKTIYSCKAAQSYRKDLAHRVSDSMSKDLKMFIH